MSTPGRCLVGEIAWDAAAVTALAASDLHSVSETHDRDVQVLGDVLLQEADLGLVLLVGVVVAAVGVDHAEEVENSLIEGDEREKELRSQFPSRLSAMLQP